MLDAAIDKNKVSAVNKSIKFLREIQAEYILERRRTDAAAIEKIIIECLEMIYTLKTGGFIDWQDIKKLEE